MTTCICLSYSGPTPLGSTIQLTCNPSGVIINESTINLTTNCPYCITVPSGTTTITAFDPVTNCTEVIPVDPVISTPCSSGMDVVFCIDYTSSMAPVINKIKQNVYILTETIQLLSQNNYRLGLVLFDEWYNSTGLPYLNNYTYVNLPLSQKYVNSNVTASRYQYITAMEVMSPNNQLSFNQNLSTLAVSQESFFTKLYPNGQQQPTDINLNGTIYDLKILPNDKLLFGGQFTSSFNILSNRIGRMFINDEQLDPTFITSNGFNLIVRAIDVNNLGQIIAGGDFTDYNGITRNGIALLNNNGSIDLGFNPGIGFNSGSIINVVKFDQNGKILVGGNFTSYSGLSYNGIVRINTDGTPDLSFVVGSGFENITLVKDIEIQPSDDKIIVCGDFFSYNSTVRKNIIRLETNGSIDPTFVIGNSFNNIVETVKIQPNGQILVGGQFTAYNFIPCNSIIRLNSDGSVDNIFLTNIGSGFNTFSSITCIELQSLGLNNGKIIVGGNFNTFNTVSKNKILRLVSDGNLDTTFGLCGLTTPGFPEPNTIRSIKIDSQDNIFVSVSAIYNQTCFPGMPLGLGYNGPEPSDMAIDRIVNYNFVGPFNSTNSKYIVLITDAGPSGNNDFYDPLIEIDFIQNTLIPNCQTNNIKVILVRPITQGFGAAILEELALSTGGQVIITPFNENFNVNQIATTLATLC